MQNFKIIEAPSSQFKTEIVAFAEEYLAGTPRDRVDWMDRNPAGKPLWLFALHQKSGDLAGMISLMPKELYFREKKIRAGILGDFMLHKKYRVFGPALQLPRAALAAGRQHGMDFIYTIPNSQSKKIIEKAGMEAVGRLFSMVKPCQVSLMLAKYIGPAPSVPLGWLIRQILRIGSRESYVRSGAVFEEISWDDSDTLSFERFWEQLKVAQRDHMIGDRRLPFLQWRYLENTGLNSRIFAMRKEAGGELIGFFVISVGNKRMHVYDLIALYEHDLFVMIKEIAQICLQEKCQGVHGLIFEKNPLLSSVRQCGFFDTKDQTTIYSSPGKGEEIEKWWFTAADRNV